MSRAESVRNCFCFATSRAPITHSQSAQGLKVRPRLYYAVSDPLRDVALPVHTETTIYVAPDLIP